MSRAGMSRQKATPKDDLNNPAAADPVVTDPVVTDIGQYRSNKSACASCLMRNCCLPKIIENEHNLSVLEAVSGRPTLQKKDRLYHQGDKYDGLYLVRSGSLKSFSDTAEGDEQITGFYLPGDMLGLDGLADGVHHDTLAALETTSLCHIDPTQFEGLCLRIPQLQRHVFKILGRKMLQEQRLHLLLSKKDALTRIAAFFIFLSKHQRLRGLDATSFSLPMSRADIGDYLGLAVETVSRMVTRLQKAGVIDIQGREVKIADLPELYKLGCADSEVCLS